VAFIFIRVLQSLMRAKAESGYQLQFVPVCWIASEDHDLDEIKGSDGRPGAKWATERKQELLAGSHRWVVGISQIHRSQRKIFQKKRMGKLI
jgi:hypothetical protein